MTHDTQEAHILHPCKFSVSNKLFFWSKHAIHLRRKENDPVYAKKRIENHADCSQSLKQQHKKKDSR
jgi:hypothetical protein